jgi:hypothetical protein
MFDIPTADFEEITDEDLEKHYIRNLNRIEKLKTHYTIREFSQSILNLREESTMGNVDLKKLNSECVKMIATVKQLYD